MAPVIFVLALLMPTVMASTTPQCLNATLPDILDLGKCLGSSLNLCNSTVENIIAALVKLVQCLITALLKLNVEGAIAALLEIIEIVLNALGIDIIKITGVIKPLCCVSQVSGCKKIFTGSELCKPPIAIALPGNLNLGKCLTNTLLLCKQGDVVTDELLANLVKAVACLLRTLLGTNPGSLITGLGCVIYSLLNSVALSVGATIKTALIAVAVTIKAAYNCS